MTRIYELAGALLLVLVALLVLSAALGLVVSVGFGAGIMGVPEVVVLLLPAALLYVGSRWCGRQAARAAPAPRAT